MYWRSVALKREHSMSSICRGGYPRDRKQTDLHCGRILIKICSVLHHVINRYISDMFKMSKLGRFYIIGAIFIGYL